MFAPARTAVRYAYAPAMLLGLNGAAYFVISRGHPYAWLGLILLTALGAASLAESVAPWYDGWNGPHDDHAANVWHALIHETENVCGVLLIPLITWLAQLTPGTLLGWWPRDWSLLAQLLLAIAIADFALTFLHFLSHRYLILWRLHAVHHGAGRLYGLNGLARHPLHQIVDMALGTAPLVLAGMPIEVAILLGFAISIQLIVQHSNVAYELGPFRNHLSLGRIHHLHHVNWGKEGDCNFGLFLTLWDRLLGTFKAEPPRAITAHDMGIDEVPDFPTSYIEQLKFPFVYKPGSTEPYATAKRRGAPMRRCVAPAE